MSSRPTRFVATDYILPSVLVIMGCAAIWWGLIEFPVFWRQSSPERIAGQIIAGSQFKAEILAQQLFILGGTENSSYCHPTALRSAAIIQLRMTESAVSTSDHDSAVLNLELLDNAIRSSLACAPADPFLWLALYWVESTRNGANADNLKYLRMSYLLGPNEGWIALKRNFVAFEAFERLPPDLAKIAVDEFFALVRNNFYEATAEIYMGPAWPERELIRSRLTQVSNQQRDLFADALRQHGYDFDSSSPQPYPRH